MMYIFRFFTVKICQLSLFGEQKNKVIMFLRISFDHYILN